MKINDAFPSKYLKADDLQHRRVTVTISHVEMEKLGDDNKAIVYFKNKEKGVVLNVTNKNMLVEICGSEETEEWAGKQITLYSTKVSFQGKMTDSIRIDYPPQGKANGKAPAPVAPAADEPEDEGFDHESVPF